MAFDDLDWASDTNYPAGSDSWSATPTRVGPSEGVRAVGVTPEDVFPAQWLNWLFGEVVDAGKVLESRVGLGTLQNAWERSEAEGETGPHLDIEGGFLRIGAPVPAIPMFVADEAGDSLFFGADVEIYSTKTLTLGNVNKLLVTGGGPGGVPHALTQTSGVGGQTPLDWGSWTPTATVVSGTGVDTTDLINTHGRWSRVGSIVTFAFHGQVQTSGWTSGLASMSIPLPVSTTHASNDSLSATFTTDSSGSALEDSGDGLHARGESGTNRITLLMNFSAAFVAGAGTANISVSGQYVIA